MQIVINQLKYQCSIGYKSEINCIIWGIQFQNQLIIDSVIHHFNTYATQLPCHVIIRKSL